MKIKFHSRREVQDEFRGTEKATVFEAGKEYDLPEASASRWVQRGLASVVIATKEPEIAKPQTQTGRVGPQVKA
jgi:hypothetical protein